MWNIEKTIKKGDYLYGLVPDHPKATKNGYVLIHRIVAENKIGRPLKVGEIVHHKNGNKKDNRPENLEVMLGTDHNRMHAATGQTLYKHICEDCGLIFSTRKPEQRFCSYACHGRYEMNRKYHGNVA